MSCDLTVSRFCCCSAWFNSEHTRGTVRCTRGCIDSLRSTVQVRSGISNQEYIWILGKHTEWPCLWFQPFEPWEFLCNVNNTEQGESRSVKLNLRARLCRAQVELWFDLIKQIAGACSESLMEAGFCVFTSGHSLWCLCPTPASDHCIQHHTYKMRSWKTWTDETHMRVSSCPLHNLSKFTTWALCWGWEDVTSGGSALSSVMS